MPVNGMAAGQFVTSFAAGKQILLTDGTVGHVLSDFAIVIGKELFVDAHATILAVSKVFSAPDATETAVRAVVGAFFVGHPEVAYGAVVFSELDVAVDAEIAERENGRNEGYTRLGT